MHELARVAGHLHDIGKTSGLFQAYIQHQAPRGGDHATAGAREAVRHYGSAGLGRLLALVIAGHHSGLADPETLDRRLASELPDYTGWQAHTPALPEAAALQPAPIAPGRSPSFSLSFAVRMLFSCLVDADFIATETFLAGGQRARGGGPGIAALEERLNGPIAGLQAAAPPSELNTLGARYSAMPSLWKAG